MLLRASFLLILATSTFAACGAKKGGRLMTDTPVLPFKAPDVEEISGVSEDEPEATPPPTDEPKANTPPTPAPVMATPAPTPTKAAPAPTKAPATPAKTPAPTPAKKP